MNEYAVLCVHQQFTSANNMVKSLYDYIHGRCLLTYHLNVQKSHKTS